MKFKFYMHWLKKKNNDPYKMKDSLALLEITGTLLLDALYMYV